MIELYSISVVVIVVVVLVDKLVVAVPSAGCNIVVGVAMIIIIRRAVVTGEPFSLITEHCCLALHSCCHHLLLVNMIVPSPALALGE